MSANDLTSIINKTSKADNIEQIAENIKAQFLFNENKNLIYGLGVRTLY